VPSGKNWKHCTKPTEETDSPKINKGNRRLGDRLNQYLLFHNHAYSTLKVIYLWLRLVNEEFKPQNNLNDRFQLAKKFCKSLPFPTIEKA